MGYREKEKLLIWMNLTDYTGLFLQASICGMNYLVLIF